MNNTMIIYCAAKDGKAVVGGKMEIVLNICRFYFNENRTLFVKVDGYQLDKFHSYSNEYTTDEMVRDAVEHLFNRLNRWGWQTFKMI